MKKISLMGFVLTFILSLTACTTQDRRISFDQLPKDAQTFINNHFKGISVSYIEMEHDDLKNSYEVQLVNGNSIDFDSKGQWTSVKCKVDGVPAAIIPQKIKDYVAAQYANLKIIKIEKDRYYEITIENGIELKFNADGQFLHIDK